MKFVFITLFPDSISAYFSRGVIGRACEDGIVGIDFFNPRDFALDKYKHVDDQPYGGGAGMVMRADVLERAVLYSFSKYNIDPKSYDRAKSRVIVLSAGGNPFTQSRANALSQLETIFFVCGRYEGIDQRFIDIYADDELSVGPYVLSGGELPAMTIADCVARLLPGVLGSAESLVEESFSSGDSTFLEYPHYTRPAVFHDMPVPEVLVSGNHAAIDQWRKEIAAGRRDKQK